MPWMGFEPTIWVFERAKTIHAVDRAVTVICLLYALGNQKDSCDSLYWGDLEPILQHLRGMPVFWLILWQFYVRIIQKDCFSMSFYYHLYENPFTGSCFNMGDTQGHEHDILKKNHIYSYVQEWLLSCWHCLGALTPLRWHNSIHYYHATSTVFRTNNCGSKRM
jgi:hypothetical protein